MQFFYGIIILMVISIISAFCITTVIPGAVFSIGTVAASFGINLTLLFLVSAATSAAISAVLENQNQS